MIREGRLKGFKPVSDGLFCIGTFKLDLSKGG